jgi:hypothetical protein
MINRFVPAALLTAVGSLAALSASTAAKGEYALILLTAGAVAGLLGLASFLKALVELRVRRRN